MSLKDQLEQARAQLVHRAGGTMKSLGQLSVELDMKEVAKRLREVHDHLISDTFKLIVLGRFKNGKSTVMNALLGRVTHAVPELPKGTGPMPTDDLPCTATLTSIRYSIKPYVKVWRHDGHSKEWSLAQYLKESTVKTDDAETQKFFENIREFELGFPAELCQSGVTLLDSPGLDDVPQRTEITSQAVKQCDAAIAVYRHSPFAGQGECEFVQRVVAGTGTRVFSLVNLWDGRQVDERLKALAWNKLAKEMQGASAYAGQDPMSKDIYFVNALKAENGKMAGDARLVEESGLALFERRLGEFLIKERQRAHVERWVLAADGTASLIEQQISQRCRGLQQDQQRLQQTYLQIQPQLKAIRDRREKLPKIFARYCRDCQRELRISFQELVNQLRQDLPDMLMRRPLPSLKQWQGKAIAVFQQKKLCEEALTICNEIITQRIKAWSSNAPNLSGAQQTLAPILERFFEEIRDEVAQIERAFAQVQFQLTGWAPPTSPTGVTSMTERVLSGVAGLLLGGIGGALVGPGGWRSVVGAFSAQFAAGFLMGLLGVSSAIVFLPGVIVAGVVGSLIGGNWGLEERIKRTVLKVVDEGTTDKDGKRVPGLQQAPHETAAKLDETASKLFEEIQTQVMESVNAEIEGEERNIQRILTDNKRDHAEKARLLTAMEEASKKAAAYRQALKQVTVEARQAM